MAAAAGNENVDRIKQEFRRYGVVDVNHHYTGGGHYQIRWRHNGNEGVVTTSATPSDGRTWMNVRGEVRRQLKVRGIKPLSPAEKVVRVTKMPRLVSTTEPANIIKSRIDQLADDHEALVDLILDVKPTLERIARATEAREGGLFRIQTEVSGRVMGLILDLLAVEEEHATRKFRFLRVAGADSESKSEPKLIEAAPTVKPLEVVAQPEPRPAEPEPEPEPSVPVVAEPVQAVAKVEAAPAIPQNHALLIYIYKNGQQTTAELREAGFTGYGGNPSLLSGLLTNQEKKQLLVRKGEEWWLTREGALFAKEKIENPEVRTPQKPHKKAA
jgi:hypothetical protein